MEMDLTETDLATSLKEALTYYLTYLSHSQKLFESKLPHQGKGVETVADISSRLSYQRRVAASETCLQYTGRIARRVRRWQREVDDPGGDVEEVEESPCVDVDVEALCHFLEANPEDPFIDPFSEKRIGGIDGPCLKNEFVGDRVQKTAPRKNETSPVIQRLEPYRRIAHEYLDQKSKVRRSRPYLGLHANVPITSLPSSETEYRRSLNQSNGASFESIIIPASSNTGHQAYTPIYNSEMGARYQRRLGSEACDWRYAEQLQAEERQRRKEARRAFVEARKLSDRLALEKHEYLEDQKHYARSLDREERKYQEKVKLNREAAEMAQARLKASEQKRLDDQRRQDRLDAIGRASDAKKKSEEIRRREWNEERNRMLDEREIGLDKEKKARLSNSTVDIKSRRQAISLADGKRWRDAYLIQEARNRKGVIEARDKNSKTKTVDCVSCMEPGLKKDMAVLSCPHVYCGECIKGAFENAYKSRAPFKCCGKAVSAISLAIYLSPSFVERYNALLIELSTPNPVYCSSLACSKFVLPSTIHGPIASCSTCQTRTCIACKKKEHPGVCQEDKEGKKVQELAKKHGWKQCPNCSQILERTAGCLHMTCRCKAEWCYACLRDWKLCKSTCGREENTGQAPPPAADPRNANLAQNRVVVEDEREHQDELRRLTEENLQMVQRHFAERQEVQVFGLFPALARGLFMAMFED